MPPPASGKPPFTGLLQPLLSGCGFMPGGVKEDRPGPKATPKEYCNSGSMFGPNLGRECREFAVIGGNKGMRL